MKLKTVSDSDCIKIATLEAQVFSDPWSEESIKDNVHSDNYLVMGAFEDEDLLGYVIYMLLSEEAELLRIAVKEEARNKGVATSLLDVMRNKTREEIKEVKTLFLEVRENNTAARKLYEKTGFVEVGMRKNYYSNPTENAVLYKMEID